MINTLIILAIPALLISIGGFGMILQSRKKRYLYTMFNQSGIDTLTLYSALDTTFDWVNATEITNITGTSLLIENSANPSLEQVNKTINRKEFFEYTFDFTLFGLSEVASQYRNKFGWLVLITFLDGETRFLDSPSFLQGTELSVNKTHVRQIQLKPNRPTGKTLKVS